MFKKLGVFSFGSILILFIGYFIFNTDRFSFNFETPFFEVLNLFIVLFLAFWIPWVVNKKEDDQKNAKSIIISEIDAAGNSFQKIDDFLIDCMSNERDRVFISVNFMMKNLSQDLYVLRDLVNNECCSNILKVELTKLINDYMSYREDVTGNSEFTPNMKTVSASIYSSHYSSFKKLSRSLKFLRLSVNRI